MTEVAEQSMHEQSAPARRDARVPGSTYRLQLREGFGFSDAARCIPYLERIGVTDLYVSPLLAANPGSPHGYDIADHSRWNPELGGEDGFAAMDRALREREMGLVVDFVPNHMGVDLPRANPWWWDVLEGGMVSEHAGFFDIDWDPVKPELKGRVLLPILGDSYGRVLERGELTVHLVNDSLVLRYFERELPINPRRIPLVLGHDVETLQAELGDDHPDVRELLSILTGLSNLPSRVETTPEAIAERVREKEVGRERLARLVERSPQVRAHIERCLAAFNGKHGVPESFEPLHELLEGQMYRLAHWRTAFHEINYRRFFDVNALASLRMEDPKVFEAAHRLIMGAIGEGAISGLRLDHVDGLFDPAGYLQALREAVQRAAQRAMYVVAEKILMPGEVLPGSWALHGTTGYEFLNDLNGVFVHPAGWRGLHRVYTRFTGRRTPFDDIAYTSKKAVMRSALASELNVLAHKLNLISESHWHSRDYTLNSLHSMLLEVVACFPVYRTYVTDGNASADDIRFIEQAAAETKRRNPTLDPSIVQFFVDVMLDRSPPGLSNTDRDRRRTFAMKFQQYTGPVQAKGVEDTAFYRYNVLLSVNEVGGEPTHFALDPATFHARNRQRREHWPHSMLCTSTHDTKRGEDARARLNALSEIPDAWGKAVSSWARIHASYRVALHGAWAPDRNDEYHYYQALLATWPVTSPVDVASLVGRLQEYMLKVVHEAKVHSSWLNENVDYDTAIARFVELVLSGPRHARFLESFLPFQRQVARIGMINGLAQLALKLMSPGVPDVYQGCEGWNLSLVDPDNRRPIDFEANNVLLEGIEPVLDAHRPMEERKAAIAEMLEHWEDGRVKMWITAAGLRLRRAHPQLFRAGDYLPLTASEERADHVVAAARCHGGECVVVVVPRLASGLAGGAAPLGTSAWGEAHIVLPEPLRGLRLENVLTGAWLDSGPEGTSVRMAEVLDACPVAFLRGNRGHPAS